MVTDAATAASVTTMASAMLFGSIMFATTALATHAYMEGDSKRLFDAASHPKSLPLDVRSLTSVYTLLFHSTVFGLILLYAYICENHPPFQHADKNYDADLFFFLTALLLVVSAFTWKKHDHNVGRQATTKSSSNGHKSLLGAKAHDSDLQSLVDNSANGDRDGVMTDGGSVTNATSDGCIRPVEDSNDETEILNRHQTEEWKGWMQFMFLLYHYYHAEEVYNAIRIMITCYVWMTGFGNFSFFYLKGDYGIVRLLQMLWRLNFLVLFLCLTQGTTYILYYICLLHTYFFFMVYVVMRIGSKHNYTKWWIRIKLAVLGIVIYLVWDCHFGLFKILHYPFLGETPMMGATAGAMWEWYFRSSLDHWSTYLGMIFALNFPITSLFFRKLEAMPLKTEILAKGATGAALLAVFIWWCMGPFTQGKFDYNQTNAYFGFIPLIAYIYFRNLTPFLRNHTLELLHQIGKTTLETYLMQHHIWLTSDAKSLLTLIPGWPKINFLLVSLIYVFMSRQLYHLTLFLRGMILPDNAMACFKNLAGMGAVIGSFCALAFVMASQDILNLTVVGTVSVVAGYTLYAYLLSISNWSGASAVEEEQGKRPTNSAGFKVSCVIGGIAVAACGIIWHTMAVTGATRIQLLPATCHPFANEGRWVATHGCDEGPRGEAYRRFGISTESTCSAQNTAYVWGWADQGPASHCRFKQRDVKSLRTHLKDRNVYFAGDSITRYLYHSFCRQLGIPDSGAYNATEGKHHDLSQSVGDINIEFIWAGFATDLVEAAKNITLQPTHSPDLVVLGGGAWDRLWVYNTDEERKDLKAALDDLAKQIQQLKKLKVPVVWLTPTTINNAALPTEEKRSNISEDEMANLRAVYEEAGILSVSSFVIEGPAFTSSRVSESFDGVHYPHQVYSAGAQILCNAIDWLLPTAKKGEPKPPPQPGAMAHPLLGLMILLVSAVGLFAFDGFMGFSYIGSLFCPSVAPKRLFYESFSTLHQLRKLPALEMQGLGTTRSISSPPTQSSNNAVAIVDEEEVVSLIGKER